MNDVPPPPCLSAPSPSQVIYPKKSAQSKNQLPASPASSIGTTKSGSKSPRPYTRKNKSCLQSSLVPPNKAQGQTSVVEPTLDIPINSSPHNSRLISSQSNTSLSINEIPVSHSKIHDDSQNQASVLQDPLGPSHRRSLPLPVSPSKCPLLCVFYAEFDIVVGPKVCFQSPQKFMQFDISVGIDEINHSLEETFQSIIPIDADDHRYGQNSHVNQSNTGDRSECDNDWAKAVALEFSEDSKNHDAELSSQSTIPASGNNAIHRGTSPDLAFNESTNTIAPISHCPSFASSSKGVTIHEGENSTVDTDTLQNSIFAATSEYIVTGNELVNQTITVSTHGVHILSRPMIISDTNRYERNSLLFSIGFVLRRSIDPHPYWPVLSSLSSTFHCMEVESEFLTHQRTRPQIQILLEDVLVSLNSKQGDCHLRLDDANLLNLKLFRPPRPPTPPVPDYAVPILIRPEWQLQMYDWDLTINWIIPHIDGCNYAKKIAQSSEVDMEMVRACLRVLRHHGALSFVDVFRYSNVYECNPLAMNLLSPLTKEGKKMLDEALWYSLKRRYSRVGQKKIHRERLDTGNSDFSANYISTTPSNNFSGTLNAQSWTLDLPHRAAFHSTAESVEIEEEFKPSSFPSRSRKFSTAEEQFVDEDALSSTSPSKCINSDLDFSQGDIEMLKKSIAILFCSCTRLRSFGEILLAKVASNRENVGFCETKPRDDNINMDDGKRNVAIGEKTINTNDDIEIDWRKVFEYFDHRRLITFGVIRGIIRRIHKYPLAYEVKSDQNNTLALDRKISISYDDDDIDDLSHTGTSSDAIQTQYYSLNVKCTNESSEPLEISTIAVEEVDSTESDINKTTSTNVPSLSPSSMPQYGIPPSKHRCENETVTNKITELSSLMLLVERIACAMNGTLCDDELSCMFELPLEKMIDMLKSTGRWNVMSVFSPVN